MGWRRRLSNVAGVRGGLGSNVYPTVAEGVFAMTNQIVAAVMKASSVKASVTPLKMNKEKGYGG